MRNMQSSSTRRLRGFTLVEVMITVAIVAILAAIALPAYTKQIRKSRRGDAKIALLDMAARQERYNTTNFKYTGTLSALGYAGTEPIASVAVPSSGTTYYLVSVSVPTAGTSFTATATPQSDQAGDTCGSFTLTDLGVQGLQIGGAAGSASQIAECWK